MVGEVQLSYDCVDVIDPEEGMSLGLVIMFFLRESLLKFLSLKFFTPKPCLHLAAVIPKQRMGGAGRLTFEAQGSEQEGGCHGGFSLFRN